MGVAAGPCNMRGWLRMHVHFHTRVCCISTQTGNVKLPGQRGLMCDISGWDCWLHANRDRGCCTLGCCKPELWKEWAADQEG